MTKITSWPYQNTLGSIVKATVEALNAISYSTPSTLNLIGADVRTEPQAPSGVPQRNNAGTTDTTIRVDYPNLVTAP
jgi:hypothetical protein